MAFGGQQAACLCAWVWGLTFRRLRRACFRGLSDTIASFQRGTRKPVSREVHHRCSSERNKQSAVLVCPGSVKADRANRLGLRR